jgi:glucose-1-phosphatase
MMDTPKKNILLDIGGVLLDLHFDRAAEKLKSFTGHRTDSVIEMIQGQEKFRLDAGTISTEEFHQEITRRLNIEITFDQFTDMWCDVFSENSAMSSLVGILSQTHNLVLASNTDSLHFNHIIENYPFIRGIRHRALSYEMGVVKPDPEFFFRILRQFRLRPQETLLIDDSSDNVIAAERVGISGIIFHDYEILIDQLSRLGISLMV